MNFRLPQRKKVDGTTDESSTSTLFLDSRKAEAMNFRILVLP